MGQVGTLMGWGRHPMEHAATLWGRLPPYGGGRHPMGVGRHPKEQADTLQGRGGTLWGRLAPYGAREAPYGAGYHPMGCGRHPKGYGAPYGGGILRGEGGTL